MNEPTPPLATWKEWAAKAQALAQEFTLEALKHEKNEVPQAEASDLVARLFERILGVEKDLSFLVDGTVAEYQRRHGVRIPEEQVASMLEDILKGKNDRPEIEGDGKRERLHPLLRAALNRFDAVAEGGHTYGSDEYFRAEQRALLAYFWPEEFKAWKERRRKARPFMVPVAVADGRNSLGSLFGRSHKGKVRPYREGEDGKGRLLRVEVSSGRTQLDLLHEDVLTVTEPDGEKVLTAISQVLGNREFRGLMACFALADDDQSSGRAMGKGTFFYRPGRFCDLLHARGPDEKHTQRQYDEADQVLERLTKTRAAGTFRSNGRDMKLTATQLVFFAHTTLEADDSHAKPEAGAMTAPRDAGRFVAGSPGQKKGGRRVAQLYQISPGLLALMDGYFLPIQTSALQTPEGVDPRTWDDAFKLYVMLAAHGRINARTAKNPKALWSRKLRDLLGVANVTAPNRPHRKARERGLKLLNVLKEQGLVFFELDGEGEKELIRYDLPGVRDGFASINHRKHKGELPAKGT